MARGVFEKCFARGLSRRAAYLEAVSARVAAHLGDGMDFSTFGISSSQQDEFERIAQGVDAQSGFVWLSTGELPSAIPEELRPKLVSAMLMWEKTDSGPIYLVFNGIRLDPKANALDQEPFGLVVSSSGASTDAVFIHHGNWGNRSVPITSDVRRVLESTSLGNHFPLGEVPDMSSGSLEDLSGASHEGAFGAMMQYFLLGAQDSE